MARGFFISFESIDGLGKTTQVGILGDHLKLLGHDVYFTKEPGDARMGSNIGAGIRQLLFHNPTTKQMHPGAADALFLADHIQNSGDIAREVAAGKIVISDRYADSQFAYSASTAREATPWAMEAYRKAFGIVPDLTILLVARGPVKWDHATDFHDDQKPGREDIAWAMARAKGRTGAEAGKQDGKIWNDIEEQRKIQDAYLARARAESRFRQIDVYETYSIGFIAGLIEGFVESALRDHFEKEAAA
jgi:dTMP kinase